MKPELPGLGRGFLAVLVLCASGGSAASQLQGVEGRAHHDDYGPEKRTFLFGKLVLVPVLAAVGLKFLALLPIVLSKIALLSAMNFLSTNLNLLLTTLFNMKSFLGKYGLWPTEDVKQQHPYLETFAEWSNEPVLQPSFRYQYVENHEATKAPHLLKVFNGFVPMEPVSYKAGFDRRTRANDKKPHLIPKESRTNDEVGKYKCYWTNESDDPKLPSGLNDPLINKKGYISRKKFDVPNTPRIKLRNLGNGYPYGAMNVLRPPPYLYNYRSSPGDGKDRQGHRQVATHPGAAEKIDESGQQPFTDAEVRVAENHGQLESSITQQPLVYLANEVAPPVKIKDDEAAARA